MTSPSKASLKRILFVDDDVDMQLITRMTLEKIGNFEVLGCQEGKEALAKVAEFEPDLILLDAMIPDLSGPEILTALKDLPQLSDIPVIFLTARSEPDDIAGLKELGAIDVITKPFDPLALPQNLRTIWLEHVSE